MGENDHLKTNNPLAEQAQQYLDLLLQGNRHQAGLLILELVNKGVTIKDIYIHIFQKSLHEIGQLWQTNRVSVAEEHYCTAATQLIMSQLYPHIFNAEKKNRRLVATSVSGELHEIGIRIVSDFFEMDGWDTYYLGASTPTNCLIETIESRQADILAVSVTTTFNISAVNDIIRQVRASRTAGKVRILVGGLPFNMAEELWKKVGADAYARDAPSAVRVANELINNST